MTPFRRGVAVAVFAAAAAHSVVAQGQTRAPLTLQAAIAEALERSPELQPRLDAIQLAAIHRRAASSEFGVKVAPTFSASSDPFWGPTRAAGVSVTKRLETGAQTFATFSSSALGAAAPLRDSNYTVGVSQPLLRGFNRTAMADVTSAARAALGAERDLSSERASLVLRVTTEYFAVVKQQRMSEAAKQAAERATALRVASEARTLVGLATELDVLRAEVLELQMGAAVAAGTGALAAAEDQLALLIGRTLGEPLEVVATDAGDESGSADLAAASIEDLVRTALSTRVEIREARDRVGDAARASEVANWNLLPPLSLDLSYTRRSFTAGTGVAPGLFGSGWRIGVSSAYALDHATEVAAADTAKISVAAARRVADETEQHVAAEVRQAYRAWQTAGATLTIQRRAVDLVERELRLAELRYERGLATSLDVVDAQNSVLQAQNALIAAELDRAAFALDLRRATGLLNPWTVSQ